MIPVQLKFSGLYSYQQTQSVDFEKLTASQLFGIFGPVGSGKSAILEAIMFVLFDRSDRLNKSGDNRYYNMLNLQSGKMEIDLIFRASAQSPTRYRAYFLAQRKKKDFEKVEVKERGQYEWKEDHWVPMADSDASSVLGMTYENFMQTVIIPQGKFREFIDQRPNARTQMLKELFQLHRFDLGAKTANLLRKTELTITDLEARLLEIGQVTEDDIVSLKEVLVEGEAILLRQQQQATTLDQQCQALDALKKLLDKINDTGQELKQLQERADFYQNKEKQLRAYMKAETFFNEKFRLLEETTIEYQQTLDGLKKLDSRISTGKQKVQVAKQESAQCQYEYEQREEIRQQAQDLQHLYQISIIEPKYQRTTEKLSAIRRQKEQAEKILNEQREELEASENQLSSTEEQRKQWQEIQEVSLWMQRYQELQQENQQSKAQWQGYKSELTQLQERKESILTSYNWPGCSTTETLIQDFAAFQTRLHTQQDHLQKEISELRVQEKLAQIAGQLQAGEPCMLCGSTEHPNIAHSPSVKQALEEKQQALKEHRQEEKSFAELQQTIQKITAQTETIQHAIQQADERNTMLEKKCAQHEQQHLWPDYQSVDSETIRARMDSLRRANKTIEDLQQARKQHLKKQREVQQQLEEVVRQEQTLLQEQAGWQATLGQHQSMIKLLDPADFTEMTSHQIQEQHKAKQQKLLSVEQSYEKARQTLQEFESALNVLEGRREVAQEGYDKLGQKAEALNNEIQTLCQDKEFDSINEVKQLIDLELNTDAEQDEILSYRNQLHNAEVTLHKLEVELQGRTYAEVEHQELREELQALKKEIQQLQEDGTLLRQRIVEAKERRVRGATIQKQLSAQQLRETNLKELLSLFRGSGFVNYASTVLLENLCQVANQRFMKLTQNSLRLELNDENEFVVRDYLNNGKTRLLKTLSGGQTFQASLCLALALAENVKSLNQADQSFFFLDEGFGSLDKESLRVVFDTLKSLRKENRIVGIISHVEDLQHEIDVFLKIERDRQKGSTIHPSWE